jgi:hypothetical protein
MVSDEDNGIQFVATMIELLDQAVEVLANPLDFTFNCFCVVAIGDRTL